MIQQKKILVAPLDWGLGHATRCIPIIECLISQNIEVIIAASGKTECLLKEYFPKTKFIFLEGYGVQYSKKLVALNFIFQVPKIFKKIKQENKWLDKTIELLKIDAVISDNRYGLYSSKIPNIIITHQLYIEAPSFLKNSLKNKINQLVSKFNECWVPDYEGKNNLSGILSHGQTTMIDHIKYIGPLSRLKKNKEKSKISYEYVGIVSGPENQRTVFENLLLKHFGKSNKKCLIICGKPNEKFETTSDKVTLVSHLESTQFSIEVMNAEIVFCRSGYSSIMDLIALDKGAVLIPTAGQREQEYLAKYLDGKFGFQYIKESKLLNTKTFSRTQPKNQAVMEINSISVIQKFIETLTCQ